MITAKLRAQINASTLRKNKPPIESSLRKALKDADSQSRIEKNLLNLKISLRCTSERFTAHNCPIRMKISELKSLLEFVCGIPSNIQRLRYLDEGELIDTKDLQYYDIIDGATINMDVYTIYVHLVKAVVLSNFEEVLKQGVSSKVEWSAPVADYMYQREKIDYIASRAGIALFIAAHRGRADIVENLIKHNVDVNYMTGFGRTAVMVSVVASQTDIINILLKHNADVDIRDFSDESAIDIAKRFKNKIGQHTLIEFKWRKRAEANAKAKLNAEKEKTQRPGFQMYDSTQKIWFRGDYAQMYMLHLEKEHEFSGTGFSAPKIKPVKQPDTLNDELSSITFDKWLAEKEQKEKAKKMEEADKRYFSKEQDTPVGNNNKTVNIKQRADNVEDNSENIDRHGFLTRNIKKWTDLDDNGNTLTPISRNETSYSQIKQKNLKLYRIQDGMTYDEWLQIRDHFLQTHNLD